MAAMNIQAEPTICEAREASAENHVFRFARFSVSARANSTARGSGFGLWL
jgi:hypothetical protein